MKWVSGIVGLGVCLVAGSAFAEHPEIIDANGNHRYVVWLRTEPGLPLSTENITQYCAVAEDFARRMWQLTNGRHYVARVQYYYDPVAPPRYDVEWRRNDGTATGGPIIQMRDSVLRAAHVWSEGSDPDGITQPTPSSEKKCLGGMCVTSICPEGFTLEELPPGPDSSNRQRCRDGNGESPLEETQTFAWTFAHEASHSKYDMKDEYFLEDSTEQQKILYGFRVCSNVSEWRTSFMCDRTSDFWCDVNTHLQGRHVNEPFPSATSGTFAVPNPSPPPGNQWDWGKTQWMNLRDYDPGPAFAQGPGVIPQNEYFTRRAPDYVLPTEPLCEFVDPGTPDQVVNDVMVVVDKSGSMNYRTTSQDLTAFEHAFSAGLAHYNRTPVNRKAGLSVFDSVVQRPIPYSEFTVPHALSDHPFVAQGTTNLCEAISDAASQIRLSGTADLTGHMLLLTDGRPTVPTCNTAEQVRRAAIDACMPADVNAKPVVISVLAFGDADYTMLDQIAQLCGGDYRMAPPAPMPSPDVPDGFPTPAEVQAAATRQAYKVRHYREAMFALEPKPLNFQRSFDIPPGTASAEFVWLAERTRFIVEPPVPFVGFAAAPPGTCDFADYGFEVVDPNGNLVGTDVVDPTTETGYMTRTRRVDNPQAGRWTMRATGGEPCVVGGTAPAPQVGMFAVYRNDDVKGELFLEKATIAANERIKATARLEIASNTFETNIGVSAKLVRGATEVAVPMVDNGTNGDDRANDGIYSAFINPTCSSLNLAAGGYRFVVELTSDEMTAQPVLSNDSDFRVDVGPDAQPEAAPVTATVVVEKLLAVGTCNNPTTACGGTTSTNLCPQQTATVSGGPITIAPGTTVPNVSVTVRNCPITSRGVSVGIGPGITASNVRSNYNDATGTGTVTFDLTARPSAPTGQHQIGIAFGRTICGTTGATITSCNPVPATLPSATVAVCGTGAAQNVTISRPALVGMCVVSPTITGRVIRSNGVNLNPPRTIPGNGVISLAPGTHLVEWTVVSGGVTRTTQQTIFVASGTTAGQSFILADRAKVMRNATEFSQVINTGTGITELGVQAHTGDITSRANVFLRDRSTVHGFVRTSGTLTRQNLTTVTGTIQTGVPLSLGGVANPPVTFPTMLPASDIVLPPDAIGSAAPGSHRKITAYSRSQLTLAAGDYLVEDLDIEPQAVVKVSPLTRLFVKNSVIYRGLFANSSGQPAPTFLAYYGTSALFLESNFSGVLLASAARAVLGDSDSRTYGGRFLAREIELRPDVTLTCSGGNGLVFDPTAAPGGTMLFSASAPLLVEPSSVESSDAEESSGCSVGSRPASERGLIGFALLALVGALRRRRSSVRRS